MSAPEYTPEDFEAWRENPITQLVMAGFSAMAERAKAKWQSDAWSNEYLDADGRERQLLMLNRAKSQAASYEEITRITLADVLAANGLDHPPNPEFEAVNGRLA
jgi:hypothetical protein